MRGWPLVLLLAFVGSAGAAQKETTTKAFADFLAAEWDYNMQQSPEEASSLGDRRWNDRWSEDTVEAFTRRYQHNQDLLVRMGKIDRAALSSKDQLNYDLFKKNTEEAIEGFKFHNFLLRLNQRGGVQTTDELADSLRFQTLKDYQDWIARLHSFPTLMDQNIAILRLGIQKRIVHPKVIMQRIPAQIDKQIVSDAAQSGFYKPFLHFSKEISAADQEQLRQEARQAVEQQ